MNHISIKNARIHNLKNAECCIAGSVPLAAVGASAGAMLFAFYLYLLPLWRLGKSLIGKKRRRDKQ